VQLHFLGANQQVTGSKYLLEAAGLKIMIDCGLFQERSIQSRNWDQPPFEPGSVDYVLLTHGHLDHCGLVPRLVAQGLNAPIITTEPSVEIATIIMLDSARIQQEDVAYKRKRHKKEKRKGPRPVVPLYTVEDAEKATGLLQPTKYGMPVALGKNVRATFFEAGHILGSASILIEVTEGDQKRTLLFSGDLGQWDKPLIRDPQLLAGADYVVLESTYGDRNHKAYSPPEEQLADIINETVKQGGKVVIPTFAVERAQELTYHIGRLVHEDKIPDVPVYLDSPMAVNVTEVFRRHRDYLDDETHQLLEAGQPPLRFEDLHLSRTVEQSKQINASRGPAIIMSTSGMCTGGRIKHHLKHTIQRPECAIVFVGFQAAGTLGRIILDGVPEVRIHRQNHIIRARIAQLHGFSAHGDHDDLLRWVKSFGNPPKQLFLTHGELSAANNLAADIKQELSWNVSVPAYQDAVELT